MKLNSIFLYLVLILAMAFTSCKDEFFNYDSSKVVEGLPARVTLNFKSQENTVVTRAERDPIYENRVDNIYIFIFDSQGNVHYRRFYKQSDLQYEGDYSKGSLSINTLSLNRAKIVGIANVTVEGATSTAYNISEADLDEINNFSDLQNKVMKMSENSVERYAIFMMTGFAKDTENNIEVQIPGTEEGTAELECTLKLERTDAKIKFVVTTDNKNGYDDFSFSPRSWVVKRVPSQSYILPRETDDYDGGDAEYFTCLERPFEVITRNETDPKLYTGGSFVYYMPENRKDPKSSITKASSETNDELYAQREKWEGKYETGDKIFLNANENSTYVEITGLLSYNKDGKNTNADIKFIVHLGNPKEKEDGSYDVNNYNTNRNTFYTYNIKISGIDDINVEVEEESENRPGYEGDVVDTENEAFVFDSHYDRCKIKINPGSIPQEDEGEIYWSVNTPFSRGVHTVSEAEVPMDLRDYRWIKFAVNAEYGVSEDEYVKYPGDQNYNDPYPFSGQANNEQSPYYKQDGDGYSAGYSDVLGRNYNSSDARLMDINQLMKYLRELGKVKKDWGKGITITVFVDEHLYFKHPIDETYPETGRSLWKLTSDKEDRILYLVINKPQYSGDGNSSVVKAEYSFRQRTIRTIYNVDHPNLQTAWGLESVMETKRLQSGDGYNNQENDTRNGRENCLRWLINKKWTDVVNTSGDAYVLKEPYNNAAFACMLRNRDLNGDNIIQDREVRWYLASIDQLTDIYLGEYALDEQSRLYPSNAADRDGMVRWHYVSSSYNNEKDKKPWVLWAEEGASKGSYKDSNTEMNGLYNYRCVRNLGIDFNHPEEVPQDLVQVKDEPDGYVLIDMSFMNPKARRSSYVTKLPKHNEREEVNRPYAKFRVHKDCFATPYKIYDGSPYAFERHKAYADTDINRQNWEYYQTSDPSPVGYRIPNQREFLIMTSRLKDNQWPNYHLIGTSYELIFGNTYYTPYSDDLGWYRPNRYICQTAFSLNGSGPYSDGLRQGFIWEFGNKVFYLQNKKDEVGYVRPVQDVH